MSIKFVCSCGKHLRARDEMAARRSMCPRCGAPVGVPSLQPTHAGTSSAPMTPQERLRWNRNKLNTETANGITANPQEAQARQAKAIAAITPPRSLLDRLRRRTPKIRRRRCLEQHWHQCFISPLLNWGVLLLLSLISSTWLSGVVLAIPKMPSPSEMSLHESLPWAAGLMVLVLIVAYCYATVEWALTAALAGEGPAHFWLGWSAGLPLKSGTRWLFCFLAGPIVPAGLAGYFWLYGGDLTAWDWAIVAELSTFAAGYWFLAIISANERNRLRDANPVRVAQLAQRLGYRAVVPLLIAPTIWFAHALLGLVALTTLHELVFAGWLLLAACWCSALFWSAFLFRLLGVWCYYTKPTEPEA